MASDDLRLPPSTGEHKQHPNEDRHTSVGDLNAELEAARARGFESKIGSDGPKPLNDGAPPVGSTPPAHSFFGVYDGHGGARCATHASSRLHLLLAHDTALWRASPKSALEAAFGRIEVELRHIYEANPEEKSGTCACAAVVRGHRLIVGWTGDCRALLLRPEGHAKECVQLTTDHRATESKENSRILKAGGEIKDGRVWGALMPSRTLGDFPWKVIASECH